MFIEHVKLDSGDFFHRVSADNVNFPQHVHLCYELIICTGGELTVTINASHQYVLKENDATLVFPFQIHSLSSTKSSHIAFIFSSSYIQAYDQERQGRITENNMFHLTEKLAGDMLTLRDDSPRFEIMGCLYRACGCFHESASYMSSGVDDSYAISKIFTFVEKNFNKDCSLETLAKETGHEYTYLSHCFKNFTGISYTQYIHMLRLNYAGILLSNTKLSVLECSIECGYNSLRSFNRNFKSYHGTTPLDYRKRCNAPQNKALGSC